MTYPDMFDWASPELRAQIDLWFEPENPWRSFRIASADTPNLASLLNPGDWIQFQWINASPDTMRSLPPEPLTVRDVAACLYKRCERHAITHGCRYPDGVDVVAGWQILYSRPYRDWEIRKLHKRGHKPHAREGEPKDRADWSPPFVAIDGRILALVHNLDGSDDCEVVRVTEANTQQLELWQRG